MTARYPPKELSDEASNRVDAAKIEAYLELPRARKAPPESEWYKDLVPQWDRDAVMTYVFRVVIAFAAEALKCVRQDLWMIGRATEEIQKFAGAFAHETGEGEAGYDRRGNPIASLATFSDHYRYWVLRPDVERRLYEMPEWQAHLQDLRAIADEQAKSKRIQDLLAQIADKVGLDQWIIDQHLDRTAFYAWKANGCRPVQGKVSAVQSQRFEQAVLDSARGRGFTTRT